MGYIYIYIQHFWDTQYTLSFLFDICLLYIYRRAAACSLWTAPKKLKILSENLRVEYVYIYIYIYIYIIGGLMGYIYIFIYPKKLQFAAYGQFVLVLSCST